MILFEEKKTKIPYFYKLETHVTRMLLTLKKSLQGARRAPRLKRCGSQETGLRAVAAPGEGRQQRTTFWALAQIWAMQLASPAPGRGTDFPAPRFLLQRMGVVTAACQVMAPSRDGPGLWLGNGMGRCAELRRAGLEGEPGHCSPSRVRGGGVGGHGVLHGGMGGPGKEKQCGT